MKVQIEGQLFIESDQMQFILKEYSGKTDKEGRENYVNHGYFTSLEGAVKKVVTMKIKESTSTTLQELITELQASREYIHSKINV